MHQTPYLVLKRLADIILSLVMILGILWWITPLVVIAIMLDSKGPILFIQSRDGKNRKAFGCIKFRTMHPNEQADLVQTQPNDPRITKVGLILRNTHIDELPQFINILFGQMSVIGPRPHMHSDTEKYSPLVDNYMERLTMKPGFTGLAQINDLCGNTSNLHDMQSRVRMDVFYVRHANAQLDLMILKASFFEILKKLGRVFSFKENKSAPISDLDKKDKSGLTKAA